MKRPACALVLVLLAGGVWSAVDNFRIRHPVSNLEVAVPGQNGPNAMLVNGWKTTPAGRQLASGDMILSGQLSPDGKFFAFTNTGYTRHACWNPATSKMVPLPDWLKELMPDADLDPTDR